MANENAVNRLTGKTIKEMFNRVEEIAELHACLTSTRGDNFRFRLLQTMEIAMIEVDIAQFRIDSVINEYHRHLNMLSKFKLVELQEIDGNKQYKRTEYGERAVNALRGFERRVGEKAVQAVYSAALGPNSIRLFLRVYGDKSEAGRDNGQIKYTPAEVGRMSLILPRTIEGISAIDKLNEAELLVYGDDDHIHMQAVRARGFYQYLGDLYRIIE